MGRELRQFSLIRLFVNPIPRLLMEQFDTLPIQCSHIEPMHEGVWLGKNIFDKMRAKRTYTIFPVYGFCKCIDSSFMGRSTSTTAFDGAIPYIAYTM